MGADNGLTLHPTKTKIVDARTDGFDFLGYHFRGTRRWPRKKSLKKLKDTIRAQTRRNNGDSCVRSSGVEPNAAWLVRVLPAPSRVAFAALDGWIRGRLRSILRRRASAAAAAGADHRRWPNAFFAELGSSVWRRPMPARQSSLR